MGEHQPFPTHEPKPEGPRFGRYLRGIRENRRLSLDTAAEMTSVYPGRVTKSHLSRIENGRADPTFPRMFALSRVYGVPIAQLAERFEADLRRALVPGPLVERGSAELFDRAEELRRGGRHDEALTHYELLLDRRLEPNGTELPEQSSTELQLRRISCLLMLSRYATAKDESEQLLAQPGLAPSERASAIQLFAQCCYRLGRYELALMALDKAEEVVNELPQDDQNHALLLQLKGQLCLITGDFQAAADAFRVAIDRYRQLGLDHEVCRHRANYAQALMENDQLDEAGTQLRAALKYAEAHGYERTKTYALHALGVLAFRQGQFDLAESYCLQSNVLARQREYVGVVFCNCYYLWKMALERDEPAVARANERTLRAYVDRVPAHINEVRRYQAHLAGGAS